MYEYIYIYTYIYIYITVCCMMVYWGGSYEGGGGPCRVMTGRWGHVGSMWSAWWGHGFLGDVMVVEGGGMRWSW